MQRSWFALWRFVFNRESIDPRRDYFGEGPRRFQREFGCLWNFWSLNRSRSICSSRPQSFRRIRPNSPLAADVSNFVHLSNHSRQNDNNISPDRSLPETQVPSRAAPADTMIFLFYNVCSMCLARLQQMESKIQIC
jgi:hypothetical protein